MKKLILRLTAASLCALAPVSAFAGPYEDGMAAQQAGKYAEAEAYFHEAGSAEAKLALGKLYYAGHGQYKAEQYNFARANYFSAAKQGNGEAQYLLAKMYDTGIGGEQSYFTAAEYYTHAAFNYITADLSGIDLFNLAEVASSNAIIEFTAENELKEGHFAKVFLSYKSLADKNNAKAQYMMARLYIAGKGVTHDKEQALVLIKKSANNGYPDAQFHLGMLYAKGTGITQSKSDAILWFKKADANKHPQAKSVLKQLGVQ